MVHPLSKNFSRGPWQIGSVFDCPCLRFLTLMPPILRPPATDNMDSWITRQEKCFASRDVHNICFLWRLVIVLKQIGAKKNKMTSNYGVRDIKRKNGIIFVLFTCSRLFTARTNFSNAASRDFWQRMAFREYQQDNENHDTRETFIRALAPGHRRQARQFDVMRQKLAQTGP